jgi:hypothetical protein
MLGLRDRTPLKLRVRAQDAITISPTFGTLISLHSTSKTLPDRILPTTSMVRHSCVNHRPCFFLVRVRSSTFPSSFIRRGQSVAGLLDVTEV